MYNTTYYIYILYLFINSLCFILSLYFDDRVYKYPHQRAENFHIKSKPTSFIPMGSNQLFYL